MQDWFGKTNQNIFFPYGKNFDRYILGIFQTCAVTAIQIKIGDSKWDQEEQRSTRSSSCKQP